MLSLQTKTVAVTGEKLDSGLRCSDFHNPTALFILNPCAQSQFASIFFV